MRKQAKRKIALGAAAVLAASMTFGSIFAFCVTAEEETVKAADLFTVSEGVTVTPATTAKNSAGEEIGNPGLYFKAPEGESEFTVNINGVFNRSAGLRWNAIGDLKEKYKEVVFEVSEVNNPQNRFEVHFAGLEQESESPAWVEYEWKGITLYRTADKDKVLPEDCPEGLGEWTTQRFFYSEAEVKTKSSYYAGMAGDTFGFPGRNYLDFSPITQKGKNIGFSVNAHSPIGARWPIAEFTEVPETYQPKEEGNAIEDCNLPQIFFETGYTISITVKGGDEGNLVYCPDLLISEIGEIDFENGDYNLWTNDVFCDWREEANGLTTVGNTSAIYSLTGEDVKFVRYGDGKTGNYTDVPKFYQRWQNTVFEPEIAAPETLPDIFVGQTADIPEATYTSFKQLKPAPVTDVKVTPPEGEAYAAGETLTVDKEGVYTITYTQDRYTKQVTFNALGQTYVRDNRYAVAGASVRVSADENGNGIRFAVVIKKDVYDSLKAAGAKFGTILIPNDMLKGDLTLDTENIAKTYTDGTEGTQDIWTEKTIDGEAYMQSVVYLYNIPESDYLRKISAVGFIEMGGEVYYTEMQSRSIGQVAWKAYHTETDAHYQDEDLKAYFEGLSEEDKAEMENLENKQ